jgi:hypothetical protein
MGLNPGDRICYRVVPEIFRYTATVQSVNGHILELRLHEDAPAVVNRGQYIMITEADGNGEHYSEVTAWDGCLVQLRRLWTGKRGFFRVDDVFPVLYRLIPDNVPRQTSRFFSGFGVTQDTLEVPDDSINPKVWRMLVDINTKLGLVLERLNLEGEGLTQAKSIPVNISASGLRLIMDHKVETGNTLELKMLLPIYPPVGVLTYGYVVRVEELDRGQYATSLNFIDLIDEVRDVIIQYTLKRQRELVRRERDEGL